MKIPLPRPMFWITVCGLLFGIFCFYLALNEWLWIRRNPTLGEGNEFATVIAFGLFNIFCLAMICWSFKQDYFFVVWGETFSAQVDLEQGEILIVKPFIGLGGKLLLCDLLCRVADGKGPQMKSFRVYSSRPSVPQVSLHLQLFGIKGDGYVPVSASAVNRDLDVEWNDREGQEEPFSFAVDETEHFDQWALHIRLLGIEGLERLRPEDLRGTTPQTPIRLKVKVSTGLTWKDAQKYTEVSLRSTTHHIFSDNRTIPYTN